MICMDLVIKHGTVATASGATVTDIGIDGGRIVQLGGVISASREINAEGMFE